MIRPDIRPWDRRQYRVQLGRLTGVAPTWRDSARLRLRAYVRRTGWIVMGRTWVGLWQSVSVAE